MKSLAPEHLADLRRSGLSDDTIAAVGIAAVPPHELSHLSKVTSAYTLPYFNLDGSMNCFKRWKLFPSLTTPDGHSKKYHQPPGSSCHVYLPPLLSWKNTSRHANRPLVFTEGEKKAACACQHGLVTAGIAGVWNWRQRLDTGEAFMIPTLDQFVWKNRPVELVPDADAWRDDRLINVLGGFYAFGQELLSRGATVRLVKLPERSGVKIGLDDWFVATGTVWESEWPALERVALDDGRLAPISVWWQRWREKQATCEAIQARDQDAVELSGTAGLYVVRSAKHAVTLTFDRLTDQRGSVYAEVTITLGATILLEAVDLNLKNDRAQTTLANSLKDYGPSHPWKLLLQKACALVMRQKRLGRPSLILNRHSQVQPLTYAVNPLVFKHKPTILYGDGGLGKSTFALLVAMLVSTGQQIAGIGALKGRALFLDWEDDEVVHTRRLQAIIAGHPSLADAQVDYQECDEPLLRMQHSLIRRIQADRISFIVVDSLLAASGGDASAESVSKMFDAIHQLKTEALLLGHIAKTPIEGQRESSVYGSVFNKNRARSTWEIKKQQEIGEDISILGLFNRKSNHSRLHYPIGLKVAQNERTTCIKYEPYDLTNANELVPALPLPARIRNLLELDGMPRTSKEISDELGAELATIKAVLSKHKGTKWHMIGEGREAKWTVLNR